MIGDRDALTITGPWPEYCTLKYGKHRGIDFAANVGEELKSLIHGEVVWLRHGEKGGKSSRVKIWPDGKKNYIYYVHCSPSVVLGQQVEPGTLLGTCDLSGKTTGGHLHYEVTDLLGNDVEPLQTVTEANEDLKFQFQKGEWDGRTIFDVTKNLNPEGWAAIKDRMVG